MYLCVWNSACAALPLRCLRRWPEYTRSDGTPTVLQDTVSGQRQYSRAFCERNLSISWSGGVPSNVMISLIWSYAATGKLFEPSHSVTQTTAPFHVAPLCHRAAHGAATRCVRSLRRGRVGRTHGMRVGQACRQSRHGRVGAMAADHFGLGRGPSRSALQRRYTHRPAQSLRYSGC